MRFLKGLGRFIWRFMVIFSFIVNLVLVVVLIGAGIFIFEIKKSIAEPLIGGLHSTAVGLENATIDWTIPVRDTIPVNLNVALNTETVVVLTQPVPLQVTAQIDLPGINAYGVAANVNLTLPAGLELPVQLDLTVPVNEPALPVSLDVRAVIPLKETQLADPIRNLALLFEPLAIALHNLPKDFNQAGEVIGQILRGEKQLSDFNLLATDGSGGINSAPYVPWAGYSLTAGYGYTLFNQPVPQPNQPVPTGFVPAGGIPFLDAQLPDRQGIYAGGGTPADVNAAASASMAAKGIDPVYYNGTMAEYYKNIQASLPQQPGTIATPVIQPGTDGGIISPPDSGQPATGGPTGESPPASSTPTTDLGIVPPPGG